MNNHRLQRDVPIRRRIVLWSVLSGAIFAYSPMYADQPVQRFLERLKEEHLQGTAVEYLDYLKQRNLLKGEFADNYALLKLDLTQSDLANINSAERRDTRVAELLKGYQDFLSTQTNHPQRGEARTKLAELYLQQGQRAVDQASNLASGDKDAQLNKARTAFQDAEKLFNSGVAELAEELKKVIGARIDPSDTEALNRREAMQSDYRKSQIMIGVAEKMVAETYPESDPQRNQWFAKAEKQFDEVSNKASRTTEAGTYHLSVLYRGQVQAAQKKNALALDSLMRVAEVTDGGIFRMMRVQATTSLIRMLAAPPENKFEAAVQRGVALLAEQQNSEADASEWQELQMTVLEAKHAWIASLKADPKNDGNVKSMTKDFRSELQKLSKTSTPLGLRAREMLAGYGIDVVVRDQTKLPKVRTFDDAFKAANERYDSFEQDQRNIQVLQIQIQNNASSSSEVQAQIEKIRAGHVEQIAQGIELYKKALKFFNVATNERNDLTLARLKLAALLYHSEQYEDAAVVGDLTARANRGSPEGQNAARIAIASYQKIIASTPDNADKPTRTLNLFSEFVLGAWPDGEVGSAAATAVLSGAINSGRFEDAVKALDYVKAPDIKAQVQRDLGYVFYGRFLEAIHNATKDAKPVDTPAIIAIRDKAESLMSAGLASLTSQKLDERAVEASIGLASIQWRKNEIEQAMQTLSRPQVGPLAVLESKVIALSPRNRMEILRLALQAEVGQATNGGKALNAARVETIIGQMQEIAAESPDNQPLLTNALVVLSNDLKSQLNDKKSVDDRKKLATSLRVLLERLSEVSDDPAMLLWSADTLGNLGESIGKEPKLVEEAKALNEASVKSFDRLLELARKNPSILDKLKIKLEGIEHSLAKRYTAAGMYEKAEELFIAILGKDAASNKLLLVQVDAAMNYQLWSKDTDVAMLEKAMKGSAPAAGKVKAIWGWGQISLMLAKAGAAKKDDLKKLFFEARYQLAVCRSKLAALQIKPELRTKYFEQALSEAGTTYISFPDLENDAEYKTKFDNLIRSFQMELKKPPIGLKEFSAPKAAAPAAPAPAAPPPAVAPAGGAK